MKLILVIDGQSNSKLNDFISYFFLYVYFALVCENSPSFLLTISSVTNTGMYFCPLCTLNVIPTWLGRIVDARACVVIVFCAVLNCTKKGPLFSGFCTCVKRLFTCVTYCIYLCHLLYLPVSTIVFTFVKASQPFQTERIFLDLK